ncbi:MAG: three-Cys-motif partner protein TcmP [Chloroflexi bacterium]|nr:three-Cys-motif partner protein TcmP [Chloroflexota bacterium]
MPTEMALIFDEIGYWSEIKLDIIRRYALEYSKILSKRKLYHIYIDAFAGSGKHISRTTGGPVPGSPQIALDIIPPFKEYYFIDIDGAKVAELNKIVANRPEAHVLEGDCNSKLLTDVFPNVMYRDFRRGLCLLDPYGLDLDWEVIEAAGQMKSIEIFLNFPVMDMNRNVLWSNPDGVDPTHITRMNTYWGDESWKEIAYRQIPNLFGEVKEIKESNKTIALAFRERLQEVAGFAYISQPLPMRNSKGAIVYYLFFASQQQVADDIIKYIFDKYSSWGMK